MSTITEIVYSYIADDEEAMECFEQAINYIEEGIDGMDLGGLIRDEFLNLIAIDNELLPLIRRLDEHVDWIAIGRRLAESATA